MMPFHITSCVRCGRVSCGLTVPQLCSFSVYRTRNHMKCSFNSPVRLWSALGARSGICGTGRKPIQEIAKQFDHPEYTKGHSSVYVYNVYAYTYIYIYM